MIPAPARQETHPGAGVCQGKKPHQGFFSNPAPHQGITWSKSTTALGMRGARALEGVRKSYRARSYDPAIGRFISEDPLQFGSGTVNFYAYVGNSSTNEIDPLGLCPPNKDCRLTVSCGPKPATHGYSHCTVTVQNGDSYTAFDGGPADEHVFWGTLIVAYNKMKVPGSGRYNFIDERVPCDCAQKEADAINAAHPVYSVFFQNSNTAAAMITQACGIFTPFRSTDIWGWGPADPITGPWGTSNMRQLPKGEPVHWTK